MNANGIKVSTITNEPDEPELNCPISSEVINLVPTLNTGDYMNQKHQIDQQII